MTEKARMRRKQLDHDRYMRNQEERKKKQREYYATHREQCRLSVAMSQYKRMKKLNQSLSFG